MRKSLISALYGIYSAEGIIDINQSLEQLGTDDSPDPLTKAERQARVVDLLRARSGVYHPVDFETDLMKKNRPGRGIHAPGTFWYYNNWDFNALGTIFEKKTGLKIGEAFHERIAKPIGCRIFSRAMSITSEGPFQFIPPICLKLQRATWHGLGCSICVTAAGTKPRSCPRLGSERALMPTRC